jgi:pyruvate kinase
MTRQFAKSNLFSLPLRALQELPLWGDANGEADRQSIKELIERLDSVRIYAGEVEERFASHIAEADPRFRESARNLLHYLSLRHFDLRNIQERLAALGLSSLGQTEAHTLSSLYAVRRALERAAGGRVTRSLAPRPAVDMHQGTELLAANTVGLLGPAPPERGVRVMVTLPSTAASDYELVRDLVTSGMDCARINCAHDDEPAWARMVEHIERASQEVGRQCKILMDLAGPKLRTGALEPGPKVLKVRTTRDERGRALAPARIWFAPPEVSPPGGTAPDAVVPVAGDWVGSARIGDTAEFVDAREAKRTVRIVACVQGGCWGETWRTTYLETGTKLKLVRGHGDQGEQVAVTEVGELPPVEIPILLQEGDTLTLRRDPSPGAPAVHAPDGSVLASAHVSCTMPEAFQDVRTGETIGLDDGKVEGVIRSVTDDEMRVEITLAKPGGTKLRADKGINFPESTLRATAITDKDLSDLDFVVRHADIVGMSFVSDPGDVLQLQEELRNRGGNHLGIVLKIETRRGFRQLPWLLLAAMRNHPVGVMIARGDLAVECGWERLAEVQEEILWLCEAAHVPVIWATQVLESLAKKGLPSRAEITDAAMAERAECVMLNKGPYITRAVTTLDHILRRMQEHQSKKRARLRQLTIAGDV